MKVFAAGCQLALTLSFFCLNTFGQSPGPRSGSVNSQEVYDPWKKTDEQWNRALQKPAPEDRALKKGLLAPSAQESDGLLELSQGEQYRSYHYGMMTNLGNVPLNEINAKDPRARFLAEYEPPRSDPKARCERRRFVIGETIDGQVYKNKLPVQVGATYLLRSINYDDSDVLVAFRVARRDDDGSVIIAWKLLREFARRTLENINVKSKCSGPIVIKSP